MHTVEPPLVGGYAVPRRAKEPRCVAVATKITESAARHLDANLGIQIHRQQHLTVQYLLDSSGVSSSPSSLKSSSGLGGER